MHRRTNRLSKALSIRDDDVGDYLQIVNGRGLRLSGKRGIAKIRNIARRHHPEVVIFDPLYKIFDGVENAAEDMKVILSEFDRMAEETSAAIVYIHHDAKGAPGEKQLVDRGSGSGVLSRDYDSAIILTPHSQGENLTVVECVLRNYAPQMPFVVCWSCNDAGDAYCFNIDGTSIPDKKTVRTKPQPVSLKEYLPAAKKILGDSEMDVSIFKLDFKDITGIPDYRVKEFLQWSMAGNMPHVISRDERGRGINKRWIKLSGN